MYEDWPETTKVLSAQLRNLRGGAPDVMKAFYCLQFFISQFSHRDSVEFTHGISSLSAGKQSYEAN